MACRSCYGLIHAGCFVFVWAYMNGFACLRGVFEGVFKNTFFLELHAVRTDGAPSGMFYNQSCELSWLSIHRWHSEHANTNDGTVCGKVVCELGVAMLLIWQSNVFSKLTTNCLEQPHIMDTSFRQSGTLYQVWPVLPRYIVTVVPMCIVIFPLSTQFLLSS